MFSKSIRKVANEASKHYTSKRGYCFELLADNMRRHHMRARRAFNPWNYHGRSSFFVEPVYYEPVRSTYEKKTIYNDNGRIIVKTSRNTPGRGWETYVEEYANDKAVEQNKKPETLNQSLKAEAANQTQNQKTQAANPTEQAKSDQTTGQKQTVESTNSQQTKKAEVPNQQDRHRNNVQDRRNDRAVAQRQHENVFNTFDREFQEISNSLTRDFDNFFGGRLNSRNFFGSDPFFAEPEYMTYHSKTVVNNNGNVTVKTTKKNAENQWETEVKHYSRDGSAVEGGQKLETSNQTKKVEQKSTEQSNKNQPGNGQTQANQTASQ